MTRSKRAEDKLIEALQAAILKGTSIGRNDRGGPEFRMSAATFEACKMLGKLLRKAVTRHENPSAPDPMRTNTLLTQIADDLDNEAGWGNPKNPWIAFLQSIGAYPTMIENDVEETHPAIPGAHTIQCQCPCNACRTGQCRSCSRKTCSDEHCKNCPNVAGGHGPRGKVSDATDAMLRKQRRQLKEARAIDSGKLTNALPGTLTGDFGKRGPSDAELARMQAEITPELVRKAFVENDFESRLKFARSIGKGKRL